MGGSIAVTLISPTGEVYKMCRWTNSLPSFIQNMKFIIKDESHIQSYLMAWFNMKRDYILNWQSGNFSLPMTPVYLPYNELAPTGYGLVIIDMQKEKILSMQDFSNLTTIVYDDVFKNDKEFCDSISNLLENNKLKVMKTYPNGRTYYKVDLHPFQLHRYKENYEGAKRMLEDIQREYILNTKELNLWHEWLEEQLEIENE